MEERAQKLGGTLTMCSEPGQGTVIVLEIEDSSETVAALARDNRLSGASPDE